jgi:hypothetical protein
VGHVVGHVTGTRPTAAPVGFESFWS